MAKTEHNWTDREPVISTTARQLLEGYAEIPGDQAVDHIKKIREKAFPVYTYPCIGHYMFIELNLDLSKVHDEVITRICGGAKYLEVACGLGQEVRYLVSKGCPDENLYAVDLQPPFIDFGYDLFRDKNTLKATFITPFDIFHSELPSKLKGKIDIVIANHFFHLFSREDSILAVKKVISFLKPVAGSLIVGVQVGSRGEAGLEDDYDKKLGYRQNEDTWRGMWDEVGKQTNSKWDVDFRWDETGSKGIKILEDIEARQMAKFYYTVRRR